MVSEPTPAPDPVFAAIAHAQSASDAYVAVFDRDDGSEAFERCRDALCDGMAETWRTLLQVQPTTFAGSVALARFALAFAASQGREDAPREALEVLSRTGVATTAAAPPPAMRSGPPRRPPAALAPRPARLPSPGLSPEAPPPRPSDR